MGIRVACAWIHTHWCPLLDRSILQPLETFSHFVSPSLISESSQGDPSNNLADNAKTLLAHSKEVSKSPHLSSTSRDSQLTLGIAQLQKSLIHVPDHWSTINFFQARGMWLSAKLTYKIKSPGLSPPPPPPTSRHWFYTECAWLWWCYCNQHEKYRHSAYPDVSVVLPHSTSDCLKRLDTVGVFCFMDFAKHCALSPGLAEEKALFSRQWAVFLENWIQSKGWFPQSLSTHIYVLMIP